MTATVPDLSPAQESQSPDARSVDAATPEQSAPDTTAPVETPSAPTAPPVPDTVPIEQEVLAGAGAAVGDVVSQPRLVIPDPRQAPEVAPSTVGLPPGTPLTVHNGDLTIRTAGAVVSNLDIRGFVRVEAPNVTIKNSIIRGRATDSHAIMIYAGLGTSAGLRVLDSELAPTYKTPLTNGVYGYGFTLTRVDIHDVIDAVHIFGDNVTVENSRLHGNLHFENDPYHSDGSHDDSIQIQSGRNIRILGNTISGSYNAAVQITQDRDVVSNVTISGNKISGGGCTVNVAEKGRGPIAGLTVSRNVFGTSRFTCHMLVPPTTPLLGDGNTVEGGGALKVVRRAQ
ncbi:right-handed parallel beta-helix repeat-containing protein [Salinibacterium sp. SYSU T00001]|uniref:right-handed parallel beta-helix repeat-containing protein n=1 Tax=Homoserinimonas sedimenticola TaxID=2986805 RepID=UPI002236C1AA|nr:right-handed parallel beta-helix repeat-containing protein [Salinibacterium sedimenticola]MCW4384739.1 right-handed parallel beta-helix repeat-containing protein [Salinibacterium sedimenticola]